MTAAVDSSLAHVGRSIPPDTPHAVSVSLPTWKANVGYEEGQEWVVSRMTTGYPRFFVHTIIADLARLIAVKYGSSDDASMLFHSHGAARRCADFLEANGCPPPRVVDLEARGSTINDGTCKSLLSAVVHSSQLVKLAKTFWQHTGEGVSSRRAEYCRRLFDEGLLVDCDASSPPQTHTKGPRRYKKDSSRDETSSPRATTNATNGSLTASAETGDRLRFLEERFGRNMDLQQAGRAKLAMRRRIAGSLTADQDLSEALGSPPDSARLRDVKGFSEDDVYLYPGGMNSIYSSHRLLRAARGEMKSICFGFPYIDTLKVLEKFGPGALFYGNGNDADLDDLTARLAAGERYLALYCEFPSNPLLRCPDLTRLRTLADTYDFALVVDETVGNFLNVHVLPFADIVVSSLTKIFSGDSNVMGGSLILNPQGRMYPLLKRTWSSLYEDTLWPEDAIFLERNSRDFVTRIARINTNAEAACAVLASHPRVKQVYYPKINPSRKFYDERRTRTGGYGGLLSATFHNVEDAAAFYDALEVEKGPSLGTNFTLASPFVVLAHYMELDWARQFGVEMELVRFSIGLEEEKELVARLERALAALSR